MDFLQGNKRTPERFVGRQAVVTAQCLNGWLETFTPSFLTFTWIQKKKCSCDLQICFSLPWSVAHAWQVCGEDFRQCREREVAVPFLGKGWGFSYGLKQRPKCKLVMIRYNAGHCPYSAGDRSFRHLKHSFQFVYYWCQQRNQHAEFRLDFSSTLFCLRRAETQILRQNVSLHHLQKHMTSSISKHLTESHVTICFGDSSWEQQHVMPMSLRTLCWELAPLKYPTIQVTTSDTEGKICFKMGIFRC